MSKENFNPSPAQDRRPSPQCGEGVVLYSFPPLHIMGRGLGGGVLTKFLALIMSLVLFAACAKRALPEEKVRGFAKFALNGGAAISQANSDEYNPYVIQMGDNYLVLVFGSNRSCGGCSGHNLFIAKSVSAYNNNSVFPAFNSPTVMTVASTPLNYSGRINFAVTAVGNNVRIHLTNAGGTVQATPNIAPDGPYDTTLATIANASGQTGTVIGYSNGDDKIISRQGSTINAYSRLAAYPLTAIPDAGSATTIAAVDSSFTSRYDGFFALVGGQVTSMSYYGSGGKISAVNTAIAKSKITPQSMTLMQGGGTTGPLMFISGTEAGGTSEDLFVVDGLTVWQMWQDLEPKPPGAPATGGGGGGGPDTTPPTIINVTSSTADGSYKNGQNINVQVVFSESVNVVVGGGAIYFAMAVPTSWNATCSSGSGTNTMNCTYSVFGSHNTADLDYFNTTAISLIGGATIKDAAGNNAVLTLPTPGTAGSLAANKNIIIDTAVPTISATAPASSTGVSTAKVSYTLSETVASGNITWTRTGGTADAASPHVQALTGAELNSGAHSNITLTNNPTLVNGTIYSVAFDATDTAGNAATTVTNTNITYNVTSPNTWHTFAGAAASSDFGNSVAILNDGGFVVVGQAGANVPSLGGQSPLNAFSASSDFWIIKYNTDGSVQWHTFAGGAGSDSANSVAKTSDGGFIVAGSANANIASLGGQAPLAAYTSGASIWVIKYTNAGAVQWHTFSGGGGSADAYRIIQASDGSYALSGKSSINVANLGGQAPLNAFAGNDDAWIIKYSSAGAVQWHTFAGASGGFDYGISIDQATDGGFIVAAQAGASVATLGGQAPLISFAGGGGSNFWTIKYNSSGAVQWHTFGGTSSGNYSAQAMAQTTDGGCIVTGYASANVATLGGQTPLNAYTSSVNYWTVKYSSAGAVQWHTFAGATGGQFGRAVIQTNDGGYAVAGNASANVASLGGFSPLNAYSASDDFWLIKYSSLGAVEWHTFSGGANLQQIKSLAQTSAGSYVLAGSSSGNVSALGGYVPLNAYSGSSDFWVVRLLSDGTIQ